MAVRKLSLVVFYPKGKAAQYKGYPQHLHFIARVLNKPQQYSLVCETQPLLTLTCWGFPTRCPFCG